MEAPQNQIYDQGGSPQISFWNPGGSPRGLPQCRVPNRNPLQTQGLPTTRIMTRESQGACPQAELRPETWLAGWLAGGITSYDQGASHALGWLASWGAGWLVG